MPFVEVFVPKGALSSAQEAAIQSRLVAEVMEVEGAPDTPQARSISWLVLHEMDVWSVGGRPVGSDEARATWFAFRCRPARSTTSSVSR